MPISEATLAYEILLRFDAAGAFKAAHRQDRRLVALDGQTLLDEIQPARPLSLDDLRLVVAGLDAPAAS